MIADDEVAVAAVTIAELLVGVLLADDTRRSSREEFVDEIRSTIPIIDYDATGGVGESQARQASYARHHRVATVPSM